MSFVTGLLLIDAPASALNNLGSIPGARTDNTVGVKMIKARDGAYPYVSAGLSLLAAHHPGGCADRLAKGAYLSRGEGGLHRRQPHPVLGR
ncbi:hypothetical protein [Candidatus Amarolinea dominans]|uniref:hypothetical protein n=1 Tax=Candidatus Amarolinea dominans TaxID=3140696 RepID=UPI0031CCC06B